MKHEFVRQLTLAESIKAPAKALGATEDFPERAATLYQPWAWLVARGWKPLENRPSGFWKLDFRGWFWIHAGLERSPDQLHDAKCLAAHASPGLVVPELDDARIKYGAIIGKARVVGVRPIPSPAELPDGWRMAGKYGFVIEDAVMLDEPVQCRGYQGFWRVPEETRKVLRKEG